MRSPISTLLPALVGALVLGGAPLEAQPVPQAAELARTGSAAGASGAYVREIIDAADGLPDTHVGTLARTRDGYLWLGTRRGLVRFDGLAYTLYTPHETRALPTTEVNALNADATGRLWISTPKGLVVRETSGSFRRVDTTQVPSDMTWEVLVDRAGRVWVAGSFGVRVGDGTRFRQVPGATNYTYGLAEGERGRIWMAGRGHLSSYAPGDGALVSWPAVDEMRVYDATFDSTGALWIAMRDGARQLDVTDPRRIRELRNVPTALDGTRAQVWTLTVDHRGAVWFGTDTRGVLRWDGSRAVAVDPPTTRAVDPVWWLLTDQRGHVWAGTSGGLMRYRRAAFRSYTDGLALNSTWSIRGERDGTIWAASDNGQVSWLDGARWRPMFTGLRNRAAPAIWPRAAGGVYVADDAGKLWIVTRTGVEDRTAFYGFTGSGPLGVFEDADGSLLASTEQGLERSVNGVPRRLMADVVKEGDDARVIMRDARGRLVVGRPYVHIADGDSVRRIGPAVGLTDFDVSALHETPGSLWIGTADSGLFVYRGQRATNLSRVNPVLRRGVNGITHDGLGSLWITSRTGLFRASLRDLERAADGALSFVPVRRFDRADGLPTTDINSDYQSQLHRDLAGRIWLPTYAGPVVFDPAVIVDDTLPPQVHVERLVVDGAPLDIGPQSRATLREHPNRVDVTFAATDALVPRRVRAQYRVLGVDTAWIDLGTRRTLSFGPLGGGAYTVEIRVAGEDGAFNRGTATVRLDVPYTLTERRWFYPLLIVAAIALAVLAGRMRLARAKERERELQTLVAVRTADLEASRAQLEVRVAERTETLSRELAERYRLEQRLASARKMESLGRLAGGVSHEINNALATVLGFAQLAQLSATDNDRLQGDLSEVVRAGRRAAGITHQLLAFARQHHMSLTAASLATIVRESQRSLAQLVPEISLVCVVHDPVPGMLADVGQIEQLLVNLVKNARDAKPRDGRVEITVSGETLTAAREVGDQVLPAGSYALLSVRDTGSGMAPETLDQLFEPFFTTKGINEGSGLGLAVVQGIVSRHQGAIEVDSTVGVGTTFRVWFPEHAAPHATESDESVSPSASETVLLVEDDATIRQLTTRMLAMHGYRVLDADDGVAAMALVGKAIEAIDVVLTDVLMPNMNGVELARRLHAARPDLPVVFMSGYAGLEDPDVASMRDMGPMLPKPFTKEQLLGALRQALDTRVRPSALT